MIIIKHRVNTIKELKKTEKNLGIEIDLRSSPSGVYLHHDPFKKGQLFSKWIKFYNHKLLVLNVKEEGLESQILKILRKNKIKKFFFHDQTFSSLLKNMNKTSISIRYSEFEDLRKTNFLFKKIKWVWIDNFNEIKLEKKFYKKLRENKVKICIVSPELVKIKRVREIKKVYSFLKKKNFKIDAVCTKKPKLWSKLKIL